MLYILSCGPGLSQSSVELYRAGISELDQGQYLEAERKFREALAAVDPGDESGPLTMLGLAQALIPQEKFAEAERIVRTAVKRLDTASVAHQKAAAGAMQSLAVVYCAARRLKEAEIMARRALSIFPPGDGDPDRAAVLAVLGQILAQQGRRKAAIVQLTQALPSFRHDSPEQTAVLCMLGSVHFEEKQWDDAARYYGRAMELPLPRHPVTAICKTGMASLELKRGTPAKALELSAEAVALASQVLPPTHRSFAAVLSTHARVLRALGRKDEARTLEARAREIVHAYSPDPKLANQVHVSALCGK
ncbi:MAG: tetratricopeptide repeat protein [Bryobacterales bacterium]|nr:tetratricopeptide repeat protein [Bryobacterales bacterium]